MSHPHHEHDFVSRGGVKLEAALRAFRIDVTGWTCVDLGSHAGGFVDCLLRHGAARVYAVDPGYGVLDYRLRRDARVIVCERTNALEISWPPDAKPAPRDGKAARRERRVRGAPRCAERREPPPRDDRAASGVPAAVSQGNGANLVTIDVGWTPQRLILPAARRCLLPGGSIITLIKPQYEAPGEWLRGGVLPADRLDEALSRCIADIRAAGLEIIACVDSPIAGHGGNLEVLWLLRE